MTQQYTRFRNILCIQITKHFAPYPKKILGQPENFNIIDNNKSISEKANFKNDIFENEKIFDNSSRDLRQNFTPEATNSSEENNDKESLVSKVVNTAKTWWGMKKAEELHPLTEEDAEKLRLMSGREYNLSFINKLLLKLAESKPNNRFSNKERLLSYMAKALASEKRAPAIANSENFSFEYNPKVQKIEKFLKEIEYSSDS